MPRPEYSVTFSYRHHLYIENGEYLEDGASQNKSFNRTQISETVTNIPLVVPSMSEIEDAAC